ncbi:MAG: hypothetical protein ACREH8_23165 [Opitutaceae bacterium]
MFFIAARSPMLVSLSRIFVGSPEAPTGWTSEPLGSKGKGNRCDAKTCDHHSDPDELDDLAHDFRHRIVKADLAKGLPKTSASFGPRLPKGSMEFEFDWTTQRTFNPRLRFPRDRPMISPA